MITFINTTDIKITEKTAVVIGKFDGEHRESCLGRLRKRRPKED